MITCSGLDLQQAACADQTLQANARAPLEAHATMSQPQFHIKTARFVLFQPPLLSSRAASPWSWRSAWRGDGPPLARFTPFPVPEYGRQSQRPRCRSMMAERSAWLRMSSLLRSDSLVSGLVPWSSSHLQKENFRLFSDCRLVQPSCACAASSASLQRLTPTAWHTAGCSFPRLHACSPAGSSVGVSCNMWQVAIQQLHVSDDLPCDAALEQSIDDQCFLFYVLLLFLTKRPGSPGDGGGLVAKAVCREDGVKHHLRATSHTSALGLIGA